jgi:hypothetical protein
MLPSDIRLVLAPAAHRHRGLHLVIMLPVDRAVQISVYIQTTTTDKETSSDHSRVLITATLSVTSAILIDTPDRTGNLREVDER